jgi:iron complex outermembrane receptor protein
VVNLITKQGIDIDGFRARVGVGDYGQLRADINMGKRLFDLDFAIWGSLYKADGQRINVAKEETGYPTMTQGGDVIVGGFGNKPSYDFGATLSWNNLQMMYSSRFSEAISPFTASYTYHPYNIEKYRTFNGIRPSTTNQTHHTEVSYQIHSDHLYLRGTVSYDNNDLTRYQVFSENPIQLSDSIAIPYESELGLLMAYYPGVFRYVNGQEKNLGFQLKGDAKYINNAIHKGSIAFGAEYNHFKFDDMRYAVGYDYMMTANFRMTKDMGKETEKNFSTFLQLKHQWKSLILNAGLRFDYRKRYDDNSIKELSPRLSLIYLRPKWNAKLSYSKSFIDAPFLYRKLNDLLSEMDQTKGTTERNLSPEYLHSVQFTLGGTEWIKGLNLELNAFYSHARDLIFVKTIDYQNMGEYKSFGLELTGTYRQKRFFANLNTTWQKSSHVTIFEDDKNLSSIPNIPDFMANTILAWNVTKNLKLFTHLMFYSKQTAYRVNLDVVRELYDAMGKYYNTTDPVEMQQLGELIQELSDYQIKYEDVSSRFLCDVGAEYTIGRVQLALNVRNLFNKKYSQSGQGTGLVPQRGRWIMISAGIKL